MTCPRCGLTDDEKRHLDRHIRKTLQIAGYNPWGKDAWVHRDDDGDVVDTQEALRRVEWVPRSVLSYDAQNGEASRGA